VIVGNALAGMISALELGKKGHPVTLINPGGPLGGYFAGLTIDEVKFDAGLVKFELDGYANQAKWSDIDTYDASKRNDVGRFMQVVKEWVLKYTPLNQLEMPKMMLQSEVYDDVILSNAYHSFAKLPFAKQAIKELTDRKVDAEVHARNKAFGQRYETLDYQTASLANHGEAMHEHIISAYLKKAQCVTADKVLARYHRVPWLPLFYPETLLQSFSGETVALAPIQFHYPKSGTVGDIVSQVKQAIIANENITIVNQRVETVAQTHDGWRIDCTEGAFKAKHLAWSSHPAHLLKALGLKPKVTPEVKSAIAVLFLKIKEEDVRNVYSLLHVLDLDQSIYRITNQTESAGDTGDMKIVAEFNTDYFISRYGEHSDDEMVSLLLKELAEMQLIADESQPLVAKIMRIPGGFLVPDASARDTWEDNQNSIINHFPDISLLALSSGFFATSINDQVVQGLHYACVMENQLNNQTTESKELNLCL
jgi:protoporphyrinogen oxidase